MAEIVEKIILDDKDFIDSIGKVVDGLEEVVKGTDDVNRSVKKMTDEGTKDQKKITEAVKKNTQEHLKHQEELKKTVGNYRIFGVSLNDVVEKLNSYTSGLKGALSYVSKFTQVNETQKKGIETLTNAVGGGTKAFTLMARGVNVLKTAIIASGIGALIIAVSSLASFLTTSQKGMDILKGAAGGLSGSMGVLRDRVNKVGEGIFKTFSAEGAKGLLSSFWDVFKEQLINRFNAVPEFFKSIWDAIRNGGSVKNIFLELGQAITGVKSENIGQLTDDLKAAFIEGKRVADAMIALDKAMSKYAVTFASTRSTIAELKRVSEDITKSYATRTAAALKAGQLEIENSKQQVKFLDQKVKLLYEQAAISENTEKDNQEIYAAEIERANAIAETNEKQVELQNKLNGLVKEQQDKLIAIRDNYIAIGQEVGLISSEEARVIALQKQKALLEEQLKLTKDIGLSLKIDTSNEEQAIQATIEALERGINRKITEGIDVPLARLKLDKIEVPESEKIKIDIPITPFVDDTSYFDDLINEVSNFTELVDQLLYDAFGSQRSEEIQSFVSGLYESFSVFSSIANEAGQIQIDNIDKQLEKLQERRSELEDGLDRETELYEKGLANNLNAKTQEVDLLLAEEERLNIEKERIQKEAQKRQLILDTATQAQSLITSSINILKGFSSIPIVGLPLGIAAVGSLLAFFVKTKIEAFKATKLEGGTGENKSVSDYFGYVNINGQTDKGGQKGYRIVHGSTGQDTGVVISGRELVLPESVSVSNSEFFERLKKGEYHGVNLVNAINRGRVKREGNKNIILDNKHIETNKQLAVVKNKEGKYVAVVVDVNSKTKEGTKYVFDL